MQVLGSPDRASLKVLIVDDSPDILKILATIVKTTDGLELIGQASDVPSAISAVSLLKPDVLVVDYQMPGGTGLDVVRAANTERLKPTIIMFSGHSAPLYREAAMKAGVDVFLDKPSKTPELIGILRGLHQENPTAARMDCNCPGTNTIPRALEGSTPYR